MGRPKKITINDACVKVNDTYQAHGLKGIFYLNEEAFIEEALKITTSKQDNDKAIAAQFYFDRKHLGKRTLWEMRQKKEIAFERFIELAWGMDNLA